MDEQRTKHIFKQIECCLASLIGGSGHLTSYSINEETFKITNIENYGDCLNKYFFEADAYRESEFMVYDEEHQPEVEHIVGSIILNAELQTVKDHTGRIMLEPWICFDSTME